MIQIVNKINNNSQSHTDEIHKHVMIFTTAFVGSDKRGSTVPLFGGSIELSLYNYSH